MEKYHYCTKCGNPVIPLTEKEVADLQRIFAKGYTLVCKVCFNHTMSSIKPKK